MNKTHLLGIFMSLLTFFIFSVGDAVRKQLSLMDYSPFFILFWASVLICSFLFSLSAFRGGIKKNLKLEKPFITALRACIFYTLAILAILSFKYLSMTDAYILILTAPLIGIIVYRIFLGEAIGAYKLWAVFLGFLGAVLVIKPGFGEWNNAYLAAIGVAICFVCSNFLLKKIVHIETKYAIIFYPNCFGVILSALILREQIFVDSNLVSIVLLVSGALCSVAAAYTMAVAVESIEASEVGLYHYIQVFFGMVIGYLVFAEVPDVYAFLGAVFIFVSGVVIYRGSKQRQVLDVDPVH